MPVFHSTGGKDLMVGATIRGWEAPFRFSFSGDLGSLLSGGWVIVITTQHEHTAVKIFMANLQQCVLGQHDA